MPLFPSWRSSPGQIEKHFPSGPQQLDVCSAIFEYYFYWRGANACRILNTSRALHISFTQPDIVYDLTPRTSISDAPGYVLLLGDTQQGSQFVKRQIFHGLRKNISEMLSSRSIMECDDVVGIEVLRMVVYHMYVFVAWGHLFY